MNCHDRLSRTFWRVQTSDTDTEPCHCQLDISVYKGPQTSRESNVKCTAACLTGQRCPLYAKNPQSLYKLSIRQLLTFADISTHSLTSAHALTSECQKLAVTSHDTSHDARQHLQMSGSQMSSCCW